MLLAIALFATVALAGCGDDDASGTDSPGAQAGKLRDVEAEERSKGPKPKIPQGPTADKLIVKDLIEGTGAEPEEGDTLGVHYVAGIYETGEEIESAWVPGKPLGFPYGSDAWVYGWEEGMDGIKVGGRRELIFPTKPGTVPPGSELGDTLVYVLDLVEIEKPRKGE
jgi:peptidylprolyl isomerase